MDQFLDLFNHINHWHWFSVSVSLIILEILLGVNFFLLWLGISAATVGVVLLVYPQLTWQWQCILFALESISCLFAWHFYLQKNPSVSDKPRLNRRNEQYIGRKLTLDEAIVNGRGRVNIDDSMWRVEGPDLPAGTNIIVVDANGVILKVEEASD